MIYVIQIGVQMIEKMSKLLALEMARALNEKEKINIFCYGLQIILNTIISITLVIVVGIFIGKPMHALFYLFTYCFIRVWAGGYHASSNGKCVFLFISFFIISIVGAEVIVLNKIKLLLCLILENVLLFLVAPVGTPENPIPESLIKKMKRKAVLSSLLVSCLVILQSDMKMKMYGLLGSLWVVILVLYGKIFKGGKFV